MSFRSECRALIYPYTSFLPGKQDATSKTPCPHLSTSRELGRGSLSLDVPVWRHILARWCTSAYGAMKNASNSLWNSLLYHAFGAHCPARLRNCSPNVLAKFREPPLETTAYAEVPRHVSCRSGAVGVLPVRLFRRSSSSTASRDFQTRLLLHAQQPHGTRQTSVMICGSVDQVTAANMIELPTGSMNALSARVAQELSCQLLFGRPGRRMRVGLRGLVVVS